MPDQTTEVPEAAIKLGRIAFRKDGGRQAYESEIVAVLAAAAPFFTAPLREELHETTKLLRGEEATREGAEEELKSAEARADSAERRLDAVRKALETAIDDRRRPGAYGTTEAQYFGYAYADRLEVILATLQDSQPQPTWQVSDLLAAVDLAHAHIDAEHICDLVRRRLQDSQEDGEGEKCGTCRDLGWVLEERADDSSKLDVIVCPVPDCKASGRMVVAPGADRADKLCASLQEEIDWLRKPGADPFASIVAHRLQAILGADRARTAPTPESTEGGERS